MYRTPLGVIAPMMVIVVIAGGIAMSQQECKSFICSFEQVLATLTT
jgi:hypothetical protein